MRRRLRPLLRSGKRPPPFPVALFKTRSIDLMIPFRFSSTDIGVQEVDPVPPIPLGTSPSLQGPRSVPQAVATVSLVPQKDQAEGRLSFLDVRRVSGMHLVQPAHAIISGQGSFMSVLRPVAVPSARSATAAYTKFVNKFQITSACQRRFREALTGRAGPARAATDSPEATVIDVMLWGLSLCRTVVNADSVGMGFRLARLEALGDDNIGQGSFR